MDLILKYFPTYGESGSYTAIGSDGEPVELETNEKESLSAQVFKTIVDPFVTHFLSEGAFRCAEQ